MSSRSSIARRRPHRARVSPRVTRALAAALACPLPSPAGNPALLVGALLARRTLCPSELARASPTTVIRRVPAPYHHLLYRLKRLWRFLENGRVAPLAVRFALIPAASRAPRDPVGRRQRRDRYLHNR